MWRSCREFSSKVLTHIITYIITHINDGFQCFETVVAVLVVAGG